MRTEDDDVIRFDKTEHIASDFLDEVRMRPGAGEQGNVALQLGALRFETAGLELHKSRPLDKAGAGFQPVPPIQGVMAEIRDQTGAEQDHPALLKLRSPGIIRLTHHDTHSLTHTLTGSA